MTAATQPRCACGRFKSVKDEAAQRERVNQELALEGALNLMAKDIEAEFDKDMLEWKGLFPNLCDGSEVM